MSIFDIPGCVFIGCITANNVNGGRPIPLFEPAAPLHGASINTLEGWNASADRHNRRSFRIANGRDPSSDRELMEWVYKNC